MTVSDCFPGGSVLVSLAYCIFSKYEIACGTCAPELWWYKRRKKGGFYNTAPRRNLPDYGDSRKVEILHRK